MGAGIEINLQKVYCVSDISVAINAYCRSTLMIPESKREICFGLCLTNTVRIHKLDQTPSQVSIGFSILRH